MKKILFAGKVTLADKLVDFRIYKNEEEGTTPYYSYETNPQLLNAGQLDFHTGATTRATTLEDLLHQFTYIYKQEFTKIVKHRENPNF